MTEPAKQFIIIIVILNRVNSPSTKYSSDKFIILSSAFKINTLGYEYRIFQTICYSAETKPTD
jgi:hypothetical protein